MKSENLKPEYLKLVKTNTDGPRNDVTPLFADYRAFELLVDDLLKPFALAEFDFAAGIDALGFILGTAIAWRTGKGFISIRKEGKLPVYADNESFVDYTGKRKSLELGKGVIERGAKILLVDEWIETGAQMASAIKLVERQGGIIAGIVSICIDENDETKKLKSKYKCSSVWPKDTN
ncbi:MAG: adenine phosphoribosyltransferase [candidate division Zixibacteria bacterium]|nr:adenine phosphoribosyltransferase [candidate division Zixibacteria bacterium]